MDEIYTDKMGMVVLLESEYKGFVFRIVTMGSHPCAYVRIPEGHLLDGVSDDDIHICVHGGLSYAEREDDGFWWIGFDFAHYGDFYDYPEALQYLKEGKKWSIEEIGMECKRAIDDIYKMKKFQKKEYYYAAEERVDD